MSAITLSEEQTKLFRLCLKHSDTLKPDWEKVAEEGEFVSTSAASQRWGRLLKMLMGEEKSATPSKAKSSTSKSGGGATKQKSATKKKGATSKSTKVSEEEMTDDGDGKTTTQHSTQTPKKRALNGDGDLNSDMEDETPTKVKKIEIKDENAE